MTDCHFPEIEALIEQLRKIQSPKVRTVLALHSQAQQACWRGDVDEAEKYRQRALDYEIR